MDACGRYFEAVLETLREVLATQREGMEAAAQKMADTIRAGHSIFAFGTNHAGLLAQELYYRTGGLVVVNYIRAPGLSLDVEPPTLTTDMERLPDYGRAILRANPVRAGDLLILHSVSGRNAVPIDMAIAAREAGVFTICLTNLRTSRAVDARHAGGKRLFEVCDLVLDNCGAYGDAAIELEGFAERVGPTSTAVGAAMLNGVAARAMEKLLEAGIVPPAFVSSNVPGGDAHNARVMAAYAENVFYLKK